MNVEQLRDSILQLAIQGKLVKQREEEGTAEELYQQIQLEKNQLIKEGKLKKSKPLPPIDFDEVPFEIPISWKWVRHNELFDISGGSQPSKSIFKYTELKGYIRLYQIRDYGDNPQPTFIPVSKASKISRKGDILLARYGASLGKVFIANDGAYNVAMARVIPNFNAELVSNKYLFYFYNSPLYQDLLKSNSRSAQAGFNKDDLIKLYFPLPPLSEQQRIVDKIEELMPLIEEYGESYIKLEDLNQSFPQDIKQSILQYAIQGKLVEQREEEGTAEELYQQIQLEKNRLIKEGKLKKSKPLPPFNPEEVPFDIPASWIWIRLGLYSEKITDYVASGSFKSLRENCPTLKTEGYALLVKTADFKNGFTNNLTYTTRSGYDFLSNSNLFGGELILSNIGSIGKVFIVPKLDIPMTLAPNSIMIKLTSENYIAYLYHFMMSDFFYKQLLTISSGTTMKKFNKTQLKSLLLAIPPLREQQRIVDKIEELMSITKDLEGELQ